MKQRVIIVAGNGRPSMQSLFPVLKTKPVTLLDRRIGDSGEVFRVYKNGSLKTVERVPARKMSLSDAIVIRYGNRVEVPMSNCIVYNQSANIANASIKGKAREMMGKAGVDIPKLVTPDNFKSEDLPILARPRTHMKCSSMVLLKTKESFLDHYKRLRSKGWYYSKFIDKDREIRMHIGHGKILLMVEKAKPKNPNTLGWGHAVTNQEWTVIPWGDYIATWCKKGCDAVKALGLDFGAVDLIIKGNKAYVLEVNTGGCLSESEYTASRYAKYFDWLYKSTKRREHWDYSKFTSGNSYAWKNFQLEDKPEPVK